MNKKAIDGLIVSGISLSPDIDEKEACTIAATELKRAGLKLGHVSYGIYKQSVDARKKNDIKLVYSVAARFEAPLEIDVPSGKKYKISAISNEKLEIKYGNEKSNNRPLIVGMGPAGLFCALLLAENGYSPIIIDRGDSVEDRSKA
jgi:uncharacterized FAD-dependent dehydrogenase